MDKLLTGNIWKQISGQASKEHRRAAAIAYVSEPQHLKLKKDDVLICDASDAAIKTGVTTAKALRAYLNSRVRLYSHPNLHSKLLVFGANVLVGSCNVSTSSANRLREAALLTTNPAIRSQALALVLMAQEASETIDNDFIERISRIKVVKRPRFVGKRRRLRERLGNRTWIIKTIPIADERYRDEEKLVEKAEKEVENRLAKESSEIAWVRWTGKGSFRKLAREGDTMIDMSSAVGSKQMTVSGPVAILKRQDYGRWTRLYYEWREDLPEMSWTNFVRRLRKVGIRSIKRGSTRELKPNEARLIETIWASEER